MNTLEETLIAEYIFEQGHPIWFQVAERIKPEMFGDSLGKIWKELKQDNLDIKILSDVSGIKYTTIVDWMVNLHGMTSIPTVEQFVEDYYARKMHEISTDKKLGFDEKKARIDDLSLEMQSKVEKPLDLLLDYAKHRERKITAMQEGGLLGFSTGFRLLDEMTYGWEESKVWVAGGYTGVGKTYFLINLVNTLLEQGVVCVIFSLEMTRNEIIDRILSLRTGLTIPQLYATKTTKARKDLITNAWKKLVDEVNNKQLFVFEDCRNYNQIKSRTKKIAQVARVGFVGLDYIQLVEGEDERDYEVLKHTSFKLQAMAKELRTSVLILSQIDNATHKEGDKSPLLGFKGSGDIGQVADVAIRIKRIYEKDSNSKYTNEYILSVRKNRNGTTGDLQYTIEFPSGRIAGQGEVLKENLEKVEERVDAETIFADIVEPINE